MNKHVQTTIAMALLLSLGACGEFDKDEKISSQKNDRVAQVIELTKPELKTTKHFNGVVSSKNIAGLSFRVPGTIDSFLVKDGDLVVKGQLLATLDQHDYQVALEELEAKLLEAKSAHALATNELRRVKQARKDDAIATVNLDRAVSAFERSNSAVQVVKKNIQRAQDALRYTELRAPYAGLVGDIGFEQHEQVLPGAPILALQSPDELQVEIDIPENLVSQMSIGDRAALSWFGSEPEMAATLHEISPFPHLIKQTYTAKLSPDSAYEGLFIGKTLTASINTASNDDSFCLPYSALMGKGNDLFVNKVENNVVRAEAVTTSLLKAKEVCVQGDLSVGDHIVVTGTKYFSDGERVSKVVKRIDG